MPIGSGLRAALLDAFAAVSGLIPPSLRSSCVLVGGTALLMHGMPDRYTDDVDFVTNAEALYAFTEAAADDPRFRRNSDGSWEYHYEALDLYVEVEFLQAGGPFAPEIRAAHPTGEGYLAGLGELARMKARACDRGEEKDRKDLKWLVDRMLQAGETFRDVALTEEDEEILLEVAEELGGGWVDKIRRLMDKDNC